jgi:hypothetical protein
MTETHSQGTTRSIQSASPLVDFLVVMLFAILGGILFGILVRFISNYFWLIVLFPIIVGFVAGIIYAQGIRIFRVRSAIAAALAGMLMGLLIYLTSYYLQYREFMELLREFIASYDDPLLLEHDLFHLGAPEGEELTFWHYMNLEAAEGFSIGRGGRRGIQVSGIFVWLYWIFEVGLTGLIIGGSGVEMCKRPFCEKCQDWYQSAKLLGSVAPEQMPAFGQAIEQGNYEQAGALIQPDYKGPLRLDVYMARCKNSAHDLVLRVDQVETTRDKANKEKTEKKEVWRRDIAPGYAQFFSMS